MKCFLIYGLIAMFGAVAFVNASMKKEEDANMKTARYFDCTSHYYGTDKVTETKILVTDKFLRIDDAEYEALPHSRTVTLGEWIIYKDTNLLTRVDNGLPVNLHDKERAFTGLRCTPARVESAID